MNFKRIIIIIIMLFIGLFFFIFGSKLFLGDNQARKLSAPQILKSVSPSPTTSPKPTQLPIDQNSNLEVEIDKLTPYGYSDDFFNLSQDSSQF